tara:strand:+ start:356 stop:631 length:276 start_codon:yes stop_codon:yes gene_type:complete
MKRSQLRKIIKEEISKVLKENTMEIKPGINLKGNDGNLYTVLKVGNPQTPHLINNVVALMRFNDDEIVYFPQDFGRYLEIDQFWDHFEQTR